MVPRAPTPNTNPNSTFNLPTVPAAPVPPSLPSPTADGNSQFPVKAAEAGTAAPSNPIADKPPVDPEGAMASVNPRLPPQGLPNLPSPNALGMPSMPGLPSASIVPPAVPMAATSLPEIDVTRAKPKIATWETKLAPSIIPPRTRFNYRRVLLPESIYATHYSRENSHLPLRETREDYEALLFRMVAKNDINATCALLNAGMGLSITNRNGETPLTVARRSGAGEVSQLLVARGAK